MSIVILVLVLFPLLLLINSRLAIVALVGAIVWLVIGRRQPPENRRRRTADEPEYPAGYEN